MVLTLILFLIEKGYDCPFPALTFNARIVFNFKSGDINRDGVGGGGAIEKYAPQRGFSCVGFQPPAVKM